MTKFKHGQKVKNQYGQVLTVSEHRVAQVWMTDGSWYHPSKIWPVTKYDPCGNVIAPTDPDYNDDAPRIMSIGQIAELLQTQADLRALENDEGGILQDLATELKRRVAALEE